jgi:hypothetical protein
MNQEQRREAFLAAILKAATQYGIAIAPVATADGSDVNEILRLVDLNPAPDGARELFMQDLKEMDFV